METTNQSAATAATTSRLTAPAATPAPGAATWDIDTSHANAGFRVRHLMVSHVRGHLGPVSGTIFIDEEDLSRSRIEVSVDARGIDSREPKRDEHLRSADFLDVANHPTVTFRSTRVEAPARAGGDLRVTGDLTIRGVTRPVTLEVEALPPAWRTSSGSFSTSRSCASALLTAGCDSPRRAPARLTLRSARRASSTGSKFRFSAAIFMR